MIYKNNNAKKTKGASATSNGMKLLIVESPAKVKTISKYLGKEYKVTSSVGHIRDLPKNNKDAIDIKGGFVPHYEIAQGKEKVAQELEKLCEKASEVVLATDPDREGEAIAWHVAQICKLKHPKRIVFHEITKPAIQEAINHPRKIDDGLRKAQEARRVLDRLFGYDLSGLIWQKVRYGLSAGRVQSPSLRILMEREREIRAFRPENYWVIQADTQTQKKEGLILKCAEEPRNEKEAERIVRVGKNGVWTVFKVEESEMRRSPRPPLITSTLQQTASTRLGFPPSKTMSIAQKLYEAGYITYMRTDSITLSTIAQKEILKEIEKKFGKEYVSARVYKTKSKSAQEAHEAIRPTRAGIHEAGKTPEQKKLYRLIWQRAISSQMSDAKLLKTKIVACVAPPTDKSKIPDFVANGSRTLSDGWLKGDPAAKGEDVNLPQVKENEQLTLQDIWSDKKQTEPPKRYTEAGLIKELEKRGIGRPSTYASIMKTLVDRKYALRENRTLYPTDLGEVVSDFVENNFTQYISDTFTAEMEDELDEIARGEREYVKTLKDFYTPFSKEIGIKKKEVGKITDLGKAPNKIKCPLCGSVMVIKLGRSGKFLSCQKFPKCRGARTMEGKEIEGPKETGESCPQCKTGKLIEREGRFGKFIGCNNYPKCKYIKSDPEEEKKNMTSVKCPECGEGMLTARRGRFGEFYSCSDYPQCKFAIKARPTGATCPQCGSLEMAGTKTIPERCSNKKCPNHNPHKK